MRDAISSGRACSHRAPQGTGATPAGPATIAPSQRRRRRAAGGCCLPICRSRAPSPAAALRLLHRPAAEMAAKPGADSRAIAAQFALLITRADLHMQV